MPPPVLQLDRTPPHGPRKQQAASPSPPHSQARAQPRALRDSCTGGRVCVLPQLGWTGSGQGSMAQVAPQRLQAQWLPRSCSPGPSEPAHWASTRQRSTPLTGKPGGPERPHQPWGRGGLHLGWSSWGWPGLLGISRGPLARPFSERGEPRRPSPAQPWAQVEAVAVGWGHGPARGPQGRG